MAQAILVEEHGGPEALRLGEHDPGTPGEGQACVRVGAAGVNFIDVYFRTGLYPKPTPFVAGVEGAGVVEALGAGVHDAAIGDRVAWCMAPGSYATRANVPAEMLVKLPEGVSDELAAASMLQGMTAHYLTHGTRETRPGDVALVHAAAGGVGLLLVQMLAKAGARVIGTCSTEEKAELAKNAGAAEIIRYTQEDFVEATRRLTQGRGVDVVYDSVGATTFDGSLRCLRPRGLLALFGQSSGKVPPLDLQRLNQAGSLFVTRPSLAHYIQSREELQMRAGAVLGAIQKGELEVRIGQRYALQDAAQAHRDLEARKTTGKSLLLP